MQPNKFGSLSRIAIGSAITAEIDCLIMGTNAMPLSKFALVITVITVWLMPVVSSAATDMPTAQTLLICKLGPGERFKEYEGWNGTYEFLTLKVDPQTRTVTAMNSVPYGFNGTMSAVFTEASITWQEPNSPASVQHSLDRLTGYFSTRWNDSRHGWLEWGGPCTRATQQF